MTDVRTGGANVADENATERVSTEGADLLTLAGVNDSNLLELSRLFGVKVSLRGDSMVVSGAPEFVQRAAQVARRMVEIARQRDALTPDDVLRLGDDVERDGDSDGDGAPGVARPPALRRRPRIHPFDRLDRCRVNI